MENIKHFFHWFEIAFSDFEQAQKFYSQIYS